MIMNESMIKLIKPKLIRQKAENTILVLWIPGFIDTFRHSHVFPNTLCANKSSTKETLSSIPEKDNTLFMNSDILLMHFDDYFTSSNVYPADEYQHPTCPHSTDNFFRYFNYIDSAIYDFVLNVDKSYTSVVMYGHSLGGLIASIYAIKGQYRGIITHMILNDPFVDWNRPSLEKTVLENVTRLPPPNWVKFAGGQWKLDKNKSVSHSEMHAGIVMDQGGIVDNHITYKDYDINNEITHQRPSFQDVPINFVYASQTMHDMFEHSSLTFNIPTLVLVANEDGYKESKNWKYDPYVNGSTIIELFKRHKFRDNLELYRCTNVFHDCFFPVKDRGIIDKVMEDKESLMNTCDTIQTFFEKYLPTEGTIDKLFKAKYPYAVESDESSIDKPLWAYNLLMYGAIGYGLYSSISLRKPYNKSNDT